MTTPPAVERGRCHDVYTPIIIDALLFLTITNRSRAALLYFSPLPSTSPNSVLYKSCGMALPAQTIYIIQSIESSQTAVTPHAKNFTEISQSHIDFLFYFCSA
jgi:hypothetical protein